MTAIWQNDGTGWRLSAPVGFPDEQTLHDLVEEAPQILPLAGNPRLVVVGKEVSLGNGYADIVAVEPSEPRARAANYMCRAEPRSRRDEDGSNRYVPLYSPARNSAIAQVTSK